MSCAGHDMSHLYPKSRVGNYSLMFTQCEVAKHDPFCNLLIIAMTVGKVSLRGNPLCGAPNKEKALENVSQPGACCNQAINPVVAFLATCYAMAICA